MPGWRRSPRSLPGICARVKPGGEGAMTEVRHRHTGALLLRFSAETLEGADLADANLYWADLGQANLRGARLDGANLESTLLEEAVLTGARFPGERLQGASLSMVRGVGVCLEGAGMLRCDLWAADLRNARLA